MLLIVNINNDNNNYLAESIDHMIKKNAKVSFINKKMGYELITYSNAIEYYKGLSNGINAVAAPSVRKELILFGAMLIELL